jgi:hypothetical protein
MKFKNGALTLVFLLILIFLVSTSFATESNPNDMSNGTIDHGRYEETGDLTTRYTDHSTWLAAVSGATTLIDFEEFADGTLITTQLSSSGISMVSGTSAFGSPNQFATASTSLPFPMFITGTLPSEPNFLSNDLSSPVFATGTITFELSSPHIAIGAYVADQSPLGGFGIEVFDGPTSLGFIEVPDRTLPNSFVGVISDIPFNRATFYAINEADSWGLDNVELAPAGWSAAYNVMLANSSDLALLRQYRDDDVPSKGSHRGQQRCG